MQYQAKSELGRWISDLKHNPSAILRVGDIPIQKDLFTPMELQMISVGEETGDIEGMVQQLATLYQEEVEYEAGQLTETLEPILLVFMAGLVTVLLLGIFLPMWNMTQMVK